MKKFSGFISEVFRALLELLGPIASIVLALWIYAALWHNFEPEWTWSVPFTRLVLDQQLVRDLLVGGYLLVQMLLLVALYGKVRPDQTGGRYFVEGIFSAAPLVVVIVGFWCLQTGGLSSWRQSDTHLCVLTFWFALIDVGTTWYTGATRRKVTP